VTEYRGNDSGVLKGSIWDLLGGQFRSTDLRVRFELHMAETSSDPWSLDPEIEAALAAFPLDLSTLSRETLPTIRAQLGHGRETSPSSDVERIDVDLPGRGGAELRIHRPYRRSRRMPCIYWMHGGGLVMGDNKQDGSLLDHWARTLGCVVISVGYRLAPEVHHPVPLEDCYAGLEYVLSRADGIGLDRDRVGLAGSSAGGGLAALVSVLARERALVEPQFQLLLYPMLDDRSAHASTFSVDPLWPPSANLFAWRCYLEGASDDDSHRAAARTEDLFGLPKTFIAVGACDGFFEECVEYSGRLQRAGVPIDLQVYGGAPHGFLGIAPKSAVARRATEDLESWLRENL
jgi:acetyl esterase/lipase